MPFSCFGCGQALVPDDHIGLNRQEIKRLYERCLRANDGKLIVHGIFARADTKNNNKRIYPKCILGREVTKYEEEHVWQGTALGELDHPNYASRYFKCLNLANISHQVLDVFWKGNQLWGTIEILKTPSGLLLWELYSQGIRLGVSSRGWASLRSDPDTRSVYVDDDFELITFDFVTEPSTGGAFLVPIKRRYPGMVPDQRKAVQVAYLGHGVVSMRNIVYVPDVPTLVRRINELQAMQAMGPAAAPGAKASPQQQLLDQLLLYSHYLMFPTCTYLDQEQHVRDYQQHLAMFATRAHLAEQAQHMSRADMNTIVQYETSRSPGKLQQVPYGSTADLQKQQDQQPIVSGQQYNLGDSTVGKAAALTSRTPPGGDMIKAGGVASYEAVYDNTSQVEGVDPHRQQQQQWLSQRAPDVKAGRVNTEQHGAHMVLYPPPGHHGPAQAGRSSGCAQASQQAAASPPGSQPWQLHSNACFGMQDMQSEHGGGADSGPGSMQQVEQGAGLQQERGRYPQPADGCSYPTSRGDRARRWSDGHLGVTPPQRQFIGNHYSLAGGGPSSGPLKVRKCQVAPKPMTHWHPPNQAGTNAVMQPQVPVPAAPGGARVQLPAAPSSHCSSGTAVWGPMQQQVELQLQSGSQPHSHPHTQASSPTASCVSCKPGLPITSPEIETEFVRLRATLATFTSKLAHQQQQVAAGLNLQLLVR